MFIAMLLCCVCSGQAISIVTNASAMQFASNSDLQFAKQYHTLQCQDFCNNQRNAGLCRHTHTSLPEHTTHKKYSSHVVHESRESPTILCSDTYNVFVPWGWVYLAYFLVCVTKHTAVQAIRFCRAVILCLLCATRLFEVTVHKQQDKTCIEFGQPSPVPFSEFSGSNRKGVRFWLCQILSRVVGAFGPRCNKNLKSRPARARRAGKARVKQARRNWKFWWGLRRHTLHKRRTSHDQLGAKKFHVRHSLALGWSRLQSVLSELGRMLLQASLLGLLSPIMWHRPWRPTRKRRKTKKTPCPTHCTYGLNQLLRGGGKGASKSTARKRAEKQEAELLQGLTQLLQSFAKPEAKPKQAPKPNAPQNPKNSTPKKPQESLQNADPNTEKGLFQALERLVFRAQQQPGTLMQRLTTLVQSANHGNNLNQIRQPRRRRKATEREQEFGKDNEPPRKRPRAGKGYGAKPNTTPSAAPSPPPGRNSQTDTKPTWADIAGSKAKPQTSKADKRPPQQVRWSLLHSAWPEGVLVPAQAVQTALEQGKKPAGAACFCQSLTLAQDLQRLTKLHQLSDVPFALILSHCDNKDVPLGSQTMHFPTKEVGKPGLRPFCVLPLAQTLPKMPDQKLKSTSVSTEKTPLATFRISEELLPKVQWEGIKADPRGHILQVFDDRVVHSTYGWKEAEFSTKRQEKPDVLLQGILRTKESFVETVLKKSGQDGLFVDRLTNQQQPRPNLWWVQRLEDEEPRAYYLRAVEEAKAEGATLAFRKGGGEFLGLRLKDNRHKPQLHAWTLHGAPKHWSGQEVLKCLFEAGCTEVAIIRPPARQRSWLVKAIVPDENAIGVMGIQAGNNVLYLNRVQHKIKRSEEVLQVIRPQTRPKPGTTVGAPNRDSKSAKNNERLQKEQQANQQDEVTENRARSRSPTGRGRSEPDPAIADLHAKFNILDCGGQGNCGYNCLAAALGLDKGESFDDIQNALTTRGRTVRHDLYKHMTKHAAEYSTCFLRDAQATEEQEAGPVPTKWQEYVEATLREGRWIDGLSFQAAAKRYGLHIIVIPLTGNDKDRPMAFGSVRSGREPVVLLLRAGHYQLAQRKAGKQWPKPWSSAEPAKLDSVAFRGGGKSCASSSKHSWRPQGTPESSKPNWRPQATPSTNPRRQVMQSKTSTKNSWRPQGTPSTKVQSQWKKRSTKNSNNSVACTTKSPATTHNKKPSVGNGVKETFVWTCNLCEQCFRYSNKRSLACARRRHIQKTHPGKFNKVHACFPRPRAEPAEASSQIPPDQRAWSCPKCNQGLGYMPRHKLKVSRDQHVMKCFKISLPKLRKMHYKSPIWKDLHKRLVEKNAANKESLTNAEIASFNQQHQAAIFRIPRRFTTSHRQDEFGCAHCTRLNQHFIPITRHKCPGADGRATFLTNGRRRAFWRQKRLEPNQDTVKFLVKQWQLTKAEVQLMESGTFNNSKIPPLTACSWYRDLTADGDIESNPGPSKAQSMECCAVNVNGRENAWAVARAVVQQRPAVAILQEHCMLSDKQADLSNFLNKRGYRSWWVAPPMARNILGQAYTSGGVAIFVRKDKSPRNSPTCDSRRTSNPASAWPCLSHRCLPTAKTAPSK